MTKVGSYRLGFEWVDLYIDGAHSGSFFLNPHEGQPGHIRVGRYDGDVPGMISTLLHEALEYAASRLQVRFAAAPAASRSSGGYMFVMNHEQFSEIVQQAGEYLASCEEDLKIAAKRASKPTRNKQSKK